jgi:hypothetical protein
MPLIGIVRDSGLLRVQLRLVNVITQANRLALSQRVAAPGKLVAGQEPFDTLLGKITGRKDLPERS